MKLSDVVRPDQVSITPEGFVIIESPKFASALLERMKKGDLNPLALLDDGCNNCPTNNCKEVEFAGMSHLKLTELDKAKTFKIK